MNEQFRNNDRIHWSLRLIGAVIGVVLGLALAIPGVQLIMLGGSWYYVVAGLAGVVAGFYIFKGRSVGIAIYLGLCAFTLVWSSCGM